MKVQIKNIWRNRSPEILAHFFSIALLLVLCKILYMLLKNATGDEWFILPWLVGNGIVFAWCIAWLAISGSTLAFLGGYTTLLYYMININYGLLFSGFLDLQVLRFQEDANLVMHSIGDALDGRIVFIFLFLSLAYAILVKRLRVNFCRISQRRLLSLFLFSSLFFLLFVFRPQMMAPFDFARTPGGKLLWSAFSSSRGTPEQDKDAKNGRYSFHQRSPYSSETHSILPTKPSLHDSYNVIILLLESTGSVSRVRPDAETMPHFSALARNGIFWRNTYVPLPLTTKTFFTLHTGLYPSANLSPYIQPLQCTLLPEYFKGNGYRTALITGAFLESSGIFKALRTRGYDLVHDGYTMPEKDHYEETEWGISDRAAWNQAKKWITQQESSFFLFLPTIQTHYPYSLPRDWRGPFPVKHDMDRYHNLLVFQDALIGEIISFLKKQSFYEKTILVLLGDHGEAFGQHRGNFIHTMEIYDENVRVPLLISNPILFPRAQELASPVSAVDLIPTLLELLNFSSSDYRGDGISLFSPVANRLIYFSTHYHENILGLRDGDFKFIYRADQGEDELYDLKTDPEEANNITKQYRDRTEYYQRRVLEWAHYTRSRPIQKYHSDSSTTTVSLLDLPILFTSQDYGSLSYNQTIENQPFTISDKKWPVKGFGSHANSIIVFDISKYNGYWLTTKFGRDQEASGGQVNAQIWIDGQIVYESQKLTSADTPVGISIPITGNTLSLVALKTQDGGVGDHVDWLDPLLIKK